MHNAKQKLMVLSSILSLCTTAFIIAAIVTPDWISYSTTNNNPQYQGLFERCEGTVCTSNDALYTPNGAGPLGNLGCGRSGSELRDRFVTTAALVIAGAVITFVVLVLQLVQVFGVASLSDTAHMWLAWTLIFSFILTMIGVAIFGGTINSWWNCGSDFCQPYKNTDTFCGVGYSYIFAIVGCVTLLIAAILVVIYTKFPHVMYPTADIILMVALLEIFSVVMLSVGVGTPHWQEVIPTYRKQGLFQNCSSSSCTGNDYPLQIPTRTGCVLTGTDLQGRYAASAAFLILAAIISLILMFVFALVELKVSSSFMLTRGKKRAVITALVLSLCAQVIGIVIATNVQDSFYFCGISYCEHFNGYCHPGVAFGFCIAAIGVTFLQLLLIFFEYHEWCCFQERFASGRQSFSIRKVLQGTKRRQQTDPIEQSAEPVEEPVHLPAGQWDYDSVSGFYWSEELYLFFDPSTQQFYDPNKDEWFTQDRRTAQGTVIPPHQHAGRSGSSAHQSVNTTPRYPHEPTSSRRMDR